MDVKIVIFDQGSNNRNLCKQLNVEIKRPYFYVKNKKKIYMYDFPNLIKSLRNILHSNEISFKDNLTASWKDITVTYQLDCLSDSSHILTKITTTHINPSSFQKMKVKYAIQIFSNSMHTTFKLAHNSENIKINTLEGRIDLVQNVNKLIDCFNTSHICLKLPQNKIGHKYNIKKELQSLLQCFKLMCVKNANGKKRNNIY